MKRVFAFLKATLLGGFMMQCISKWGGGSGKLLAAYDAARAASLVNPTNQQQ